MTKYKYTEEEIKLYKSACPYMYRDNSAMVCFGKYFMYDDSECYRCELSRKCYCLTYKNHKEYEYVKSLYLRRKYSKELKKREYQNHIQLIAQMLSLNYFDNFTYKNIADFVYVFWKKNYKQELRISASIVGNLLRKFPRLKALRLANKKRKNQNPLLGLSNKQEQTLRTQIKELKDTGRI